MEKIKWCAIDQQKTTQPSNSPETTSKQPSVARYTFHIPAHDNDGNQIHHLIPVLRRTFDQAGLKGRTILRDVEADNGDNTHRMHIISIDTDNTPEMEQQIKTIAEGAKQVGNLEGLYITRQLLDGWVL